MESTTTALPPPSLANDVLNNVNTKHVDGFPLSTTKDVMNYNAKSEGHIDDDDDEDEMEKLKREEEDHHRDDEDAGQEEQQHRHHHDNVDNVDNVDEDDNDDNYEKRPQEDENASILGHTFRQRRLTYTRLHVQNAAAAAAAVAAQFDDSEDDDEEEDNQQQQQQRDDNRKTESKSSAYLGRFQNAVQAAAMAAAAAFVDSEEEEEEEEPFSREKRSLEEAHHEEEEYEEGYHDAALLNGQQHQHQHHRTSFTDEDHPDKRRKLESTESAEEQYDQSSDDDDDVDSKLQSRILHADEITLVQKPDEQAFIILPHNKTFADSENGVIVHRKEEETLLPFPRHIVGTYSCHGMEPLYDDDLYDDDDDTEEKGGVVATTTVAKINQDRGSVAFPYGDCHKTALFAAYDGHGEGGELVAQFAMTEIQHRLHDHPLFDKEIAEAFRDTFVEVDEALRHEPEVEPLYSGSTTCAVLMRDNVLTISNVGDSRAVLARRKKGSDHKYVAIDLSEDQNPDSPGEQERIEQCGGFVSPPPEEGLSARVWLDPEFTQIGLAMARSIGDHAVKRVGVISEPVVTRHELTPEDEFMVIATDGVWEFIDSEEAVEVIAEHFAEGDGASRACQGLIEVAAAKWHEHEGDYRDDITALVIKVKELRRWW